MAREYDEQPIIEEVVSPLQQLASNEPVVFDIDRAKRAIRGIESGGNYEAIGPITKSGDRAYGIDQVMGKNIPQWTEEALGVRMTPQEFLKNQNAQEKVFEHKFGQYVNKYGNVADAASAWFSGRPIAQAGNRSDVLGTTVPNYVAKFLSSYNSEGAGQPRGSVADRQEAQDQQAADVLASITKKRAPDYFKLAKSLDDSQSGSGLINQVMRQAAQSHQAARSKSLSQIAEFDKELVDKLAKQVQGYATGGQVTDDLTKLYQDVLGRKPDEEGLAYWQKQANQGATLDDIRKSFEASPEKQLLNYYNDILGRAPDTEGFNYWQNRVAQGMDMGDIKNTFQNVAAQEFDPTIQTPASQQWKTWWGYNPNQKDYDAMLRAALGEAPAGSPEQYRAIYEALGNRAAIGDEYKGKGDIASIITPSQVQGAFNISNIKSLMNTDAGAAARKALEDYLSEGQNRLLTNQTDWRGFQNNQPSTGQYSGRIVPGDVGGLQSYNTFFSPIGNEKAAQKLADMQRRNNAIYGAEPFVDVKNKPDDQLFVNPVVTNPFDTTDFSSSYTAPTSYYDPNSYDPYSTINSTNNYYSSLAGSSFLPMSWSTGSFSPGTSSLDYLGPMIGTFDFSPSWSSLPFKDGGQFKAMFDEDTPEMQDRAKELAKNAYTNRLSKDQRKEWESLAAKYNLPLSLGEFNTYEDQYSDALSKWQRGLNPNERAQYHSLGGLVAKYADGGEVDPMKEPDVGLSIEDWERGPTVNGKVVRPEHPFAPVFNLENWKKLPDMSADEIKNKLYAMAKHYGEGAVNFLTAPGKIARNEMDINSPEAERAAAWFTNLPLSSVPLAMGRVSPNTLYSGGRELSPIGLYSHAAEVAEGLPQAKGTADQMISMLRKAGVKPAELENAGLIDAAGNIHPDWQKYPVTREELAKHLQWNMPQVEESVLGAKSKINFTPEMEKRLNELTEKRISTGINEEEMAEKNYLFGLQEAAAAGRTPTRFSQYTLPGGENYREVRLKLPFENEPLFTTQHWPDAPNTVAHIRMSDRTGPNGEKLLHVEELQSDWAQKGRKEGFAKLTRSPQEIEAELSSVNKERTKILQDAADLPDSKMDEFVKLNKQAQELLYKARELDKEFLESHQNKNLPPTAPYVTSTQGWTDLALKRVMKEAAEGGYDGVVFTPGAEQANRYKLSNQVKSIDYMKEGEDAYRLGILNKQGDSVDLPKDIFTAKELENYLGKEVAQKIINDEGTAYRGRNHKTLEGMDLEVGGQGMKGYYDKIVPTQLQKLVKPLDKDVKLGTNIISSGKYEVVLPNGKVVAEYPDKSSANAISKNFKGSIVRQNAIEALHMPMTDKMRAAILEGQKAFKRGGRVGYNAGGLVDGGGTNIDGAGGLQYDAMGNLTESQGGPVHAIPYDQNAVNSLAKQLQDGSYAG